MAYLYEIKNNFKEIIYRIDEYAEEHEGEISEELIKEFSEINETFSDKAEAVVFAIKNYESDATQYAEAEKMFREKKQRAQKSKENLKKALLSAMSETGNMKVKTKLFSIGMREYAHVAIEDEKSIPDAFIKVKREIAKEDIKRALESGLTVTGAKLEKTTTLSIR